MTYRTNLCIQQCVLITLMLCAGAAPALGKGKPQPPPEPPPVTPPVSYDITWFNMDDTYEVMEVYDVNREGTTITGRAKQIGGSYTAVTIDVATGSVQDLNTVLPGIPDGWRLTSARGISSSGKIAGNLYDDLGQRSGLFVYDPNAVNPFQPVAVGLPELRYRDMNEVGDLLYAQFGTSNSYLYTHDDQLSHALPESLMKAGENFAAGPLAINDDRLIAGNREGNSTLSAYVYDYEGDTTTAIPQYFQSVKINNDGVVVGKGNLSGHGKTSLSTDKATLYDSDAGKKSLLTDAVASEGRAINDFGQVSGIVYDIGNGQSSDMDAFFYDPAAGFWTLDDLMEDNAEDTGYWNSGYFGFLGDYYLTFQALSDPLAEGYPLIVGNRSISGTLFEDGVSRHWAFMLTPTLISSSGAASASIPEPAAFVSACLGALMLIRRSRFRRR